MYILLSLLLSITTNLGNSEKIPFDALSSYFLKGNAKEIIALGKEKVSITILEKSGVYSSKQAELVLSNFFKENPPKKFEFIFKGKATGTSSFAIGTLVANKTYRLTLKFKKFNTDFKIESITIEKS